ncbi:transmembrane E3 ubiquitin-protein ligase FLY2-like [Apium graveolens]|uniref:transmembrane E3 ubiquitin-protein ligase FLY2-like n=1 Tax=Apium graveolens TaxID=4045 RepID=UPI003D79D052
MAISEASKEMIWLKNFLEELGKKQADSALYSDSQSAIHLAKNPAFHARTRHIQLKYHFRRELISNDTFFLMKILCSKNPADMLTKVVMNEKLKLCWQPTSPFDWNITGKYAGSWRLMNPTESNPIIRKSSGDSVLKLISTPTTSKGVYHVKGMVIFYKVFEDEHKVWGATIKIEGDYIWPLRLLRAVAYTEKAGESGYKDDYNISNPHYSFGLLTSQDFQEFQWVKIWNRKLSPVIDMEKHCNITVRARISRVPSMQSNEDGSSYHIEAALVRFLMDDNGDCLPPMQLNATSVNTEMFFDKAFNYNLMVTFISLLQVLLLIQQRKHSNTQSGAVKVSSFTIGQQAIMDAYLCLLHLTAGITVGN